MTTKATTKVALGVAASIARFARDHKVAVGVATTVVALALLALGAFLLWFLHFRHLGRDDIRLRLNTVRPEGAASPPRMMVAHAEAPGEDAYVTDARHVPLARNQGPCGSCTTFAMATVLAVCFNKQNRLKAPVSLSPQLLLACRTRARVSFWGNDWWRDPCMGFYTVRHAKFLRDGYVGRLGASSDRPDAYAAMPLADDLPYTVPTVSLGVAAPTCALMSGKGGMKYDGAGRPAPPACGDALRAFGDTCSDRGPLGDRKAWTGFKVRIIEEVSNDGDRGRVERIKDAIRRYGAVACNCVIKDNFERDAQRHPYEYDPEDGTEEDGGHAVTCVGWKPGYWLILNSWGRNWGCGPAGSYVPGGSGYFYLRFGAMVGTVFSVVGTRVRMPGAVADPVRPAEVDASIEDVDPHPAPPPTPKKKKKPTKKDDGGGGGGGGFCAIL